MRRVVYYVLLPLLAILILGSDALAQGAGKYKNFPVPFGPTNAGREFWLAFPANWDNPAAAQYYIRLYITSGVRTQVRVWAGAGIKKVLSTKPYDIVTVDLSPIEAQMFTRNDRAPIPNDQIYRRRAVHIDADAPIVVYGMNRTSFTSDGLLALPVNALGREYVISSYAAVIGGAQELPSQYMVVAPYNNTTLTVEQTSSTPNHAAGERITMQLDSGDVWSAMTVGFGGDMSGTTIRASKPVAVTAGQACTYIPNQINFCCCDHLTEMLLPLESWGKLYQGVPFQTRLKGDFWRVFAGANNTTVSINGSKYATLAQVGGDEGSGWFEYRALGKEMVEFTADKPIQVTQFNPSQAYDGVPSDPFFLTLTPHEQFQTALTFCTPSADFAQNYVNLVCDSLTYRQVEIADGGTNNWTPLYKYAGVGPQKPFPTLLNGRRYVGLIIDLKPGVYRMRAPQPFGGYIYGFTSYDSYGYPLSVAVGDLSTGDSVAPVILTKQTCDGSVDGQTYDLPDDSKIRTNLATIEMDPDVSYNYNLIVDRFEAGVSPSTKFYLRVIDQTKPAAAYYVVTDKAGNATYDSAIYRPFTVALDPLIVDFGNLNQGDSKRMTVTIRNLGSTIVDVSEMLLKLKNQGFTLLSPIGGFQLGPAGSAADSYEAELEFTATAEGDFTDSLGVRDTCGLRFISLLKASVGKPIITVSDIVFDPQLVGTTSAPKLMEVENIGTGNLHVTAASGPTNGVVFKLPNGLPLFPFDLKAKQRVQFQVTFTPDKISPPDFTDQIVFNHNAPADPRNDSIGLITGPGILPSLIATSYKWDRIRVGRNGPPAKVMLINLGNAPVQVNGVSYAGDQADFTLNQTQIVGRTIAAAETVFVDVNFRPTVEGPRLVRVTYDANPPQPNPVVSTLEGVGVVPMLATTDYNFGSMNLGDPEVSQPVEFWIPLGASQYLDSVQITGFQWRSDQFGGKEDFRRLPLDQPVTLIPGQTDRISFTGFFQAQAAGARIAELKAITNDGVDTTSHWNGFGVAQFAAIDGTGGSVGGLCVGDTGLITATIQNNGAIPLDVDSLVIDNSAFEIVSPDPKTKFTLGPTQQATIIIRFIGTSTGTQLGVLSVYNTTNTPKLDLALSGTSRSDVINSIVKLVGTKGSNVELGRDMMGEVWIDPLPPGSRITGYRVTIPYDTNQLWARTGPADIQLGEANTPGAVATLNTTLSTKGLIVIDVTLTTPITAGGGRLVIVPFGVMFTLETQRFLSATVDIPTGGCLAINGSRDTIEVEPVCGLTYRLIDMTNGSYSLDQNKPNPFNPVTKIRYSLGLDGQTQLVLIDASGKLVQKLINEYQKPGVYEVTLDVTNLPTGNYYYKLISGAWSQTRMLTVVK